MKGPNTGLLWSMIGFCMAVGILVYFFYRGATGASLLELTEIITAYFLFGFVVITAFYWIGKRNLEHEIESLKRQERSTRLHKGMLKVLIVYGTAFLIFMGLSLLNHLLNKS